MQISAKARKYLNLKRYVEDKNRVVGPFFISSSVFCSTDKLKTKLMNISNTRQCFIIFPRKLKTLHAAEYF